MTRHFDYCPNASEGDNQSVRSSAPVVSRCFPGGYNVKLYISRGRLAWWLLAFLHSEVLCGKLDMSRNNYTDKMHEIQCAPDVETVAIRTLVGIFRLHRLCKHIYIILGCISLLGLLPRLLKLLCQCHLKRPCRQLR